MRTFLPVVFLVAFATRLAFAAEPDAAPKDFAYSEIHTVMSDSGVVSDTQVKRVKVSGDYVRMEHLSGSYDLIDPHTGHLVTISPEKKTYVVHDRQIVIDINTGRQKEVTFKLSKGPSLYAMLTYAPDGSRHELLPDVAYFDRPPGIGHSITHSDKNGTRVIKYWLDTQTNRLNHVETTWTPKGASTPKNVTIRKDFDYTEVTDRSMFSLIPPAGFRVTSKPIMALSSSTQ